MIYCSPNFWKNYMGDTTWIEGKVVEKYGVKIVGPANLPAELATDSSALFARNLLNFITPMVDKEAKALKIDTNNKGVRIHLTGEVQQHLGGNRVRAVALGSTEGLGPQTLSLRIGEFVETAMSTSAINATGMFTQKIARQVHSVR